MKFASIDAGSLRAVLMLLLLLALGGCGAGGGGDTVAGGGIGGSGITVSSVSVGAVTGLGSIIVNDVTYDTAAAEIFVEGVLVGEGDAAVRAHLSQGMVVRVEGRRDEDGAGAAARVLYNDTVEGPLERITALDPLVTELVVLGQTVRIEERTVFRDGALDSLVPGNLLEVSGFHTPEGVVVATYVRRKAESLLPGASVDLKGVVRGLDPLAGTFRINALTVDYRLAAVSGFPSANPEEGRLAEVSGRWIAPGLLEAAQVAAEDELGRDDVDTAEIEGFITEVGSGGRFVVGAAAVAADSSTVYADMLPGDLSPGKRVRVRGALSSRLILADEVRSTERVVLESDAAEVTPESGRLALNALAPIIVQTDAATRFAGVAGLSQIAAGDHVKIFGRQSGAARVTAALIIAKPAGKKVELTGPVDSVAPPALIGILGVMVDTATIPAGGFADADGRPVSGVQFFASVKEGDRVSAGGELSGQGIAWNRIEGR